MRRLLVPALAIAVLTGCGSTAPGAREAAQTLQGSAASGRSAGSTTSTTGGLSVARTPLGSTPGGTIASAAMAPPKGHDPLDGVTARGITAATVNVGIGYVTGFNEMADAAGVNKIAFGDFRAMLQALVDHVNAHGGLRHRRIIPVWHEYEAKDAADTDTMYQSACFDWTQDHQTFVTLGPLTANNGDNTLIPCLAQHDVAFIGGGGDDSVWRRFHRYQVNPSVASLDREFKMLVDSLIRQRFFSPAARVGILYYDRQALTRAVTRGLVPYLAARGVKVVDVEAIDNDNWQAGVANTVLKFKTDNITHVLFGLPGGGGQAQFMRQAQSQQYTPRYAIGTQDGPIAVEQLAPPEQLKGAVGYGYNPTEDVQPKYRPKTSAALASCLRIFSARGIDTGRATDQYYMALACDAFRLLQRAMATMSAFTTAALEQSIDQIGTGFDTAATFDTRLAPGQHDGADAYGLLRYAGSCSCFTYHGDRYQAPR